jgi:hypothetical protein
MTPADMERMGLDPKKTYTRPKGINSASYKETYEDGTTGWAPGLLRAKRPPAVSRDQALTNLTQAPAGNMAHLDALELRLSHERGYLAKAKTEKERELRNVWISQIQKEIDRERGFLGLKGQADEAPMSDDELMAELMK